MLSVLLLDLVLLELVLLELVLLELSLPTGDTRHLYLPLRSPEERSAMSNLFEERNVEDVYDSKEDHQRITNLISKFKQKFGEVPHFLVR